MVDTFVAYRFSLINSFFNRGWILIICLGRPDVLTSSKRSQPCKTRISMLAETPYVKNLENEEYLKVILDGKATLAERFAEIDSEELRKAMKKHEEEQDRLRPRVKKLIGDDNLLKNIENAYLNRERMAA